MSSTISSSGADASGPAAPPASGERSAPGSNADPGRPLRIVFTNTSRTWGGNEHYVVQTARGLARRGHHVHVLWSFPVVGDRVRAAGLSQERFSLRGDFDPPGLWKLARSFAATRADVVVLTRWREYLLGGLAAKLTRRPRTIFVLGLRVDPENDLKRRLIFRLGDRVVVNAVEIRDALLRRPWIDPDRIRVVHNGVDLAHLVPGGDPLPFRRENGIPAEAPLVGTVGVFSAQKGHEILVRAASRVLERYPDVYFTIVGDGDLRPRIEAEIAAHGLGGRFLLPGFREDVRPALAAFDVFALSSTNEGMPWATLEALACGLPVVATDVSGTRACVEDGRNGTIVPPGDANGIAAAIGDLLAHPARRRSMGLASRRIAEERFGQDAMVDGLLEAMTDATGLNPG